MIPKELAFGSLDITADTGDVECRASSDGLIRIATDTGHIRVEGVSAGELALSVSTGDVNGSLLSEKVFLAQSDTGRIEVPETTTGGVCKIVTDTGSIRITVP